MPKNVATDRATRRQVTKFSLTHQQVMELSVRRIPASGGVGKRAKLVERPPEQGDKAYRVLDGNQGAPVGFGFYVGKTRTTYEVVRRGAQGVRRFALGNVTDMGLEEAYSVARELIQELKASGENPKTRAARASQQQQEVGRLARLTVSDCFDVYIADMRDRVAKRLVKQSSLTALEDSLARLSRPEVGFAQRAVADVTDDDVEAAFEALRKSAMVRSNRIPTPMREALAGYDDWAELDTRTLESLGITGKYVQRVRASGLAATEHSFTDAHRAVAMVLKRESVLAGREGRESRLRHNPLQAIFDRHLLRGARNLRKHYEKAAVRNPLTDNTLPKVLQSIVGRRDEQGGHNAGASDYLLLTLLWGTRRSEAAQLRWMDRCSHSELIQEEVSWVWLGQPGEINRYTKREGPQVFMFDTKSGEERFLPISYFAERVLRLRFETRLDDEDARRELAAAESLLKSAKAKGAARTVLAALEAGVQDALRKVDRTRFVFPARSSRSKSGHYLDSKSILANVRRDAGLVGQQGDTGDIRDDVDQGLTTHDLRRTLGRYAALKFGESRIVSQMLHHHVRTAGGDGMSPVSERYTQQEWARLRDAFGEVEEMMVARSPRVWNRLKGLDKPRLDEAGEEPVKLFAPRNRKVALANADD